VVALSTQGTFGQLSVDCINATPVCTTLYNVNVLPNPYPPNTIPGEISTTLSCLSSGETNGFWYTFTAQTTGMLSFNIKPVVSTTDYDWALFDLTNNECADLPGMAPISCNYSNSVTNGGITGANGGNNNQDEDTIHVTAGQTFVLFISNFSASTSGYQLDFSNSTATIPDNSIPSLLSAVPSDSCGATSLILEFSENITCSSINAGDFTLTGPGGSVPLSSISGCGGQYSSTFNLNLTNSLTEAGAYTLTLIGGVNDVCGNTLAGPIVFNFNYNALDVTVNVVDATCGNNDGSASVIVNGGLAPFNYAWDDGFIGGPAHPATFARGPHSVTVVDARLCTITVDFYVNDPTSFTFGVTQIPDTCSKGNGVLTANVVGTTAPYIYNFGGAQIGPSNTYTNAIGDSTYIIIVTDNLGCWWPDTVTVANITNDSLLANFTTFDQEIDFLFPTGSFNNNSEYETSVQWLVDGNSYGGDNLTYTFPNYGDYPVSIIAFDRDGCRDTFTMMITVKVILDLFIPNAITANEDGLNEIFYVKGIGMDSTTFELTIFDGFGREIFRTNDLTKGWNGRPLQGTSLTPQDVYVYRVFVRDIYGDPYTRNGRITVIR